MQKLIKTISFAAVLICLLSACSGNIALPADIKCKNCAIIIENDLQKTDGVRHVNADMEKQLVIIQYDKNVVSEQELSAVLNKTIEKFGAYDMSKCDIAFDCTKCCKVKCCKVVTGKTTCGTGCESSSGCSTDSKSDNEKCCDKESKTDKKCCDNLKN